MKIRLLLLICLLCPLVLLQSCTKKEVIAPVAINIPPGATDTLLYAKNFSVMNVLQSNMVVQRDKPFVIWGNATPGYKVTVKVSWNISTFTTITNTDGSWKLSIPAAPANATPQTIISSVNGLPPIKFTNILIGDVWVCSGQSNMVMPLDSIQPFYGFEGVVNYKAEIAAANYPEIRVATVSPSASLTPADSLLFPIVWNTCSPATAGTYSAVSYYFARKLNLTLNVPIGLVISAVSGTYCEEWTSEETIQSNPILNSYYNGKNSATVLYNANIYPLKNLSIKGFIWYQGENNRDDSPVSNYTLLNSAMINGWRSLFDQGSLPFYFVQMTPYARNFFNTNPWGDDPTADDYAFFREAQANIRAVPNTGMAVTMDAGQLIFIHPQNKKPVGERLALLALKNVYGQKVQCVGPQYSSYVINSNTAVISFVPGTATGLSTIGNAPVAQYFFVAGTDHVFRQGTAVINGEQVTVTAPPNTPLPVQAVRYAFTDFPFPNMQNSAGLPMEPFRTDNWSN